ncbi:MAG: hypothetical protein ACI9OJ_003029 [Myxococcota bacterium]|jgi:hypothetical protein
MRTHFWQYLWPLLVFFAACSADESDPKPAAFAVADVSNQRDTSVDDTGALSDVPGCTPSCGVRECGDDGCGGSCGTCTNLCTGDSNATGLCIEGTCAHPCGTLSVQVTYSGSKTLTAVTASAYVDMDCATALTQSASAATVSASGTLAAPIALVPLAASKSYALVVRATGPENVAREICKADVAVDGAQTSVSVALSDGPAAVSLNGTYALSSELDFGASLPPSIAGFVANLDEMSDDHDIFNEDPTNDQYGQDPAAFVLDFVYRQFCCWEAIGPDADFGSCKDQDVQHKAGDLSAIYLQDFTQWEGAQPVTTGLCGALGAGVDPLLQAIVIEVLEANAPGLGNLLAHIPTDLGNAIRHMRIRSELQLSGANVTTSTAFNHRLVTLTVTLHNLEGVASELEIDLAKAGIEAPAQSGMVTANALEVTLPLHVFPLDVGKLISHIYTAGLLPLLGYESSLAMVSSWVDCVPLSLKLEEEIPDLGFLDEEDYEKFCGKGLEEAADFIDDTVAEIVEAKILLSLSGSASVGEVGVDGIVQTLISGVWAGQWKEGDAEGLFPGTFDGHRGMVTTPQ